MASLPLGVIVKRTFLHVDIVDEGSPTAMPRRTASEPPTRADSSRLLPTSMPLREAPLTPHKEQECPSDASTTSSSGTRGRGGDRGPTTVMMRNIPRELTRSRLLELLHAGGFCGDIDFLYLPVHFSSGANTGFAFVNLRTPAAARRFRAHFARFADWGVPAPKRCNVSWARDDQQGLEANTERYRNSSVMHSSVDTEHQPVVLINGKVAAFPPPTRPLWPPHADFGVRAGRARR